jgi:hypothetical protein
MNHTDKAKVRSAVGIMVGVGWVDGCDLFDWWLLVLRPRPLHVPYGPRLLT